MDIGFVVAGFPKCGSSSLAYNLRQHPEIYFGSDEAESSQGMGVEDYFFWSAERSLLPSAALVESFNNRTCCFTGESEAPEPGAWIRGEKQPSYVYHEWVLHSIAYSGAKVILVLCDSIDQLQSGRSFEAMTGFTRADFELLEPSDAPAVACPTRGRFVHWLRRLLALVPSERLFLIHRDTLNAFPSAYDTLATFLGASPFPAGARLGFRRNQNRKRNRTTDGLCAAESADVLASLREYYAEDYADLPLLLAEQNQFTPPSLLKRRTLCD
jgi:hypothetical protein